MSQDRLMKILLAPVVSEKASLVADKHRQIVFKVMRDANKSEIKKAVELMFDVKVDSVQVVNQKGKTKRFGKTSGRRSDVKKAYVKLHEGSDIEFATS